MTLAGALQRPSLRHHRQFRSVSHTIQGFDGYLVFDIRAQYRWTKTGPFGWASTISTMTSISSFTPSRTDIRDGGSLCAVENRLD